MSEIQTESRVGPVFSKLKGMRYLDFLSEMHEVIAPEWYFEIGTNTGSSLAKSSAKSVAVDPSMVLAEDVWTNKPQLHLHQTTSDDFFAEGHLQRLGAIFQLAFLDGMHLYEFLLRDFMNTERFMSEDGCIVLHDCVPFSVNMALRDRSQVTGREWTGDVWKLLPILQQYRPDLKIQVFDAARTGLVVVSDLNPKSTMLLDNYDEIIKTYDKHDDVAGYLDRLDVRPTSESPWRRRSTPSAKSHHFAIKSPAPRPGLENRWGDTHFAVGLQNALCRLGHTATVRTRKHWDAVEKDDEIDLIISGNWPHNKRDGRLTLEWLISSVEKCENDHTFVASAPLAERLADANPDASITLLPQAFDADRIPLPAPDALRSGVLFVGTARKGKRPLVNYAMSNDVDLDVWGPGWADTDAAPFHRGDYLDNSELGAHYARAEVVLNDHTKVMRRNGIASNRMFDALACGTPVISDPVAWIPEELEPFVERVGSPKEFSAALARIRAETDEKRKARYDFAVRMRETHSFDARATEILRVVRDRLG